MKHEDFSLDTATPVNPLVRLGIALPFGKTKQQAVTAKDIKLPAALMNDDFFSGF